MQVRTKNDAVRISRIQKTVKEIMKKKRVAAPKNE